MSSSKSVHSLLYATNITITIICANVIMNVFAMISSTKPPLNQLSFANSPITNAPAPFNHTTVSIAAVTTANLSLFAEKCLYLKGTLAKPKSGELV